MKAGTPSQRQKAADHQLANGVAKMPNFSSAVSAQRFVPKDGLDDYPTPPWGARAWAEHVAGPDAVKGLTCWEPAANRGYLLHGLKDYFGRVIGSDVYDYGAGFPVYDFLAPNDDMLWQAPAFLSKSPDWIVTNPPFNRLTDFTLIGLGLARVGVAILCRTQATEGIARFNRIYDAYADRYVFSQFVERISFVRGLVDPDADRPAAHGWLTIWKEPKTPEFLLGRRHIPPCRARLERDGDYPTNQEAA